MNLHTMENSPLEKEVKILSTRVEELLPKLRALHAVDLGEEIQTNIVLDFPGRPLSEGDYFRIRSFENSNRPVEVTYKSLASREDMRASSETTMLVTSQDDALKVFQKLGMTVVHRGVKKRHSFSLMGARLDFDEWMSAGYPEPYLEIEVESDDTLQEVLTALDLNDREISLLSISQLIQQR